MILEQLEVIEDPEHLYRLHKNICFCIKVIFSKRHGWDSFKWVNSSVTKLDLSTFLSDTEHCSPEHEQLIKDCAKLFVRRMDTIALTEIFTNPEHLTRILRTEAIEKWTKLEIMEEEINRLKVAQEA